MHDDAEPRQCAHDTTTSRIDGQTICDGCEETTPEFEETYFEYTKVTRLSDGSEIREDMRREVAGRLADMALEAKAIGWDKCLMAVEQDAWVDWATNGRPRNPYRAEDYPEEVLEES